MSNNQNIYRVTITNDYKDKKDKGKTFGLLQEVQAEHADKRQAEFEPLSVLADLIDITEGKYNRFVDGYTEHPFFLGREYNRHKNENELSGFVYDDTPSDMLYRGMVVIWNTINADYYQVKKKIKFSLGEFEIIKQTHKLKFSCEIGFKHKRLFEDEFYYSPISYSNETSLKAIFEENNNTPYRFMYTCYSMEDIIFSVFHFLVLMDYKFNMCHHCLKFFATTTLKRKYCNRKSPYPKYEHLPCEEAVRNIKQLLARKRKVIYDKLSTYYAYAVQEEFVSLCDEKKKIIDKHSTVEDLKDYEDFLSKKNIKRLFYKPDFLSSKVGVNETELREKFGLKKEQIKNLIFPDYEPQE